VAHASRGMTMEERILALVGQKSYGLIAKEVGVTRNVVAGIIFRKRYPHAVRVATSPFIGRNKIGTGYRTGPRAPQSFYSVR
jgi:hypothetical protein